MKWAIWQFIIVYAVSTNESKRNATIPCENISLSKKSRLTARRKFSQGMPMPHTTTRCSTVIGSRLEFVAGPLRHTIQFDCITVLSTISMRFPSPNGLNTVNCVEIKWIIKYRMGPAQYFDETLRCSQQKRGQMTGNNTELLSTVVGSLFDNVS